MKIDIEGFDEHCVQSLMGSSKEKPSLPKYISVEALPHEPVVRMLNLLGCQKFKVVDQSIFPGGSSGPWGEDALDMFDGNRWLNFTILQRKYPTAKNGIITNWHDVHAKCE